MKTSIGILLVFLFFQKSVPDILQAQEVKIKYDDMSNIQLSEIKYDTLECLFFYENLIEAYIQGDAVIKTGGYIKIKDDINKSYLEAYYVLSSFYAKKLASNNSLHYDSLSINTFESKQYYQSIQNGTFFGETKINPFCGVYYKKYKLKIEVVKVGWVTQRIPYFQNCDEIKKRKKNYQIADLPTYIITNVFEYKEY